jgi:putative nucleotidyltransferase with HDIG domain
MNKEKANIAFEEYVNLYDRTDSEIKLKHNHTYRTCEISEKICDSLNLSVEQKYIAYLIALLHDIGRFYQDKMFNTFDDLTSFDHGDYGANILFEDGLIRKFVDDDKYNNIIKLSIRNHNKFKIEDGLNDEELLQSKIIRDADKIDIIYNVSCLNEIDRYGDESEISEKLKNDFKNLYVDSRDIKTNSDKVLAFIGFVYDLNFDYSFKYLKEKNYINMYYDRLKHKEKFKPYFDEINKYIEKRCNDVR